MPSDDWTQLEQLNAHLEDLHHRRLFALRHYNARLLREIDDQIALDEGRRRRLIDRITLGVAGKA